MKLKTRNLRIKTGGALVCLLHKKDAEELDIHLGDRVAIRHKLKSTTAIVDITSDESIINPSEIGLFKDLKHIIYPKDGESVDLSIAKKPESIKFIKKKLDGFKITPKEIDIIVKDIAENKLTDVEITYFVSSCYTNILDLEETVALTKSMINHGDVLKLKRYPVIDKHCVGGVAGNRTTMVLVPIIAAAGLTIPKTSSRSITSPAGTADTMEVLCNVSMPLSKMKSIVMKTNGCLTWGGAINLAPADDKIIRVEHPLSIDARSQLLASILAKKGSVSATHILFDIPIGKGSKFEEKANALSLKRYFEIIGKKLGMIIKVIITNGSQPIGNGHGPALEARDVMLLLKNHEKAPQDLRKKSLYMAGLIFEMAGISTKGNGLKKAEEILVSGKAYKKMLEIIKAQGPRCDPDNIKFGHIKKDIKAIKSGTITHIDNKSISHIARIAGAPKSPGAGLYLYKHVGNKVKKGDVLYTVYSSSNDKMEYVIDIIKEHCGIDIK